MAVSFKISGQMLLVILLVIVTDATWKWDSSSLYIAKQIYTEKGQKLTDCVCPANQAENDGKYYCGTDLKPLNNNKDKCHPDVIYRCIGSNKKAILDINCTAGSDIFPTKGLKCKNMDCETHPVKERCLHTKTKICA